MRNVKLGAKIGASFGLMIVIALVLGGLAVYNMLMVGSSARDMDDKYLPEVLVSNSLERHALLTMYAIRGYGLSENRELLREGRQELAKVREALDQAAELAQKYPILVKLRQNIDQAQAGVKQYAGLVDRTERADAEMDSARKQLDSSAAQYMENAMAMLRSQDRQLEQEIRAGAPPAALNQRHRKITLTNDIIDLGNATRIMTFKAQALRQPEMVTQALDNFPKIDGKLTELRQVTRLEEDLRALDSIKAAADSYQEAMRTLLANWRDLQELGQQRDQVAGQVLAVAQTSAEAGLIEAREISSQSTAALTTATYVMIGGLIVALIIGVTLAVVTTRSVTRPVLATGAALKKVASGELMTRMEEGHLNRGDELGDLARDLQKMADDLSNTVREVMLAADTVAASASEISQGNQDLSQRTQQQASAIEETASAIEEMTSSVKQNAENSRQANDLAKKTAGMASEGGDSVKRTMEAMEAVTESSKKISDIINVVNEIAFQTNLLALNAAVEAARAGEAGRGFAVVAGEVRNLAGRSAQAAKEIQGLITDSVNKVEQSNDLVNESGRLLNDIISNVKAVADTVGEITASSQEQAQGIDEVNKAVSQMDEGVQQNAALVEEAASSSEQMASAAEELRAQMGQFKVDGGGRRPAALPEPKPRPAQSQAAKGRAGKAQARQGGGEGKKAQPTKAAPAKKSEEDDFFGDDLEGFEEF
jgi:methyl-accepting chemotaxis protein